jgi:hypothetical protein
MEGKTLKQKLHDYIDTADEKKLQAIYVILEDEIEGELFYGVEEIKTFYERRQKHLSGSSKSHTPDEAHKIIRANRKK